MECTVIPGRENVPDSSKECLPILASPPAPGGGRRERAPEKYTEQRQDTVEEKLRRMKEMRKTEQVTKHSHCQARLQLASSVPVQLRTEISLIWTGSPPNMA